MDFDTSQPGLSTHSVSEGVPAASTGPLSMIASTLSSTGGEDEGLPTMEVESWRNVAELRLNGEIRLIFPVSWFLSCGLMIADFSRMGIVTKVL